MSEISWNLSIIVPVLNESDSLEPFIEQMLPVLIGCAPNFEILFIDDGSTDDTLAQLKVLNRQDARIRYVSFSRNFGKEAALTAGLRHATGDAVVPMDVDLQDPPELIPEFVRLWREESFDMVYGVRASRPEDSAAKRTTAKGFYHLFNRITHSPIPGNAGDYRLMSRRVVDVLLQLPERNRFMKGLYAWAGFKTTGVPYQRPSRHAGESKFSFWKLWNFALDGLVGFSTIPLRVWSYIGAGVALLAFLYIVVLVAGVLIGGRDVPGYASLMSVVLFFGGMQLLSIGILGEYIARLFIEVKGRPLYVLQESSEPDNSHLPAAHDHVVSGHTTPEHE
ncbi:MAG: glycosyltransferase family 2 protein [Halomonadaceae bacterium]|uniref:Glycosyltransferase family 2 protein n=1 Tax=Halomonas colorata TaxID=2742615 RepID=A0ABR9G097_9GAMM|nr:glycosyltransferase family 2 protein [Halomonas colorata]MBE0464344.1 glycosyltransferase family 2 protein [Halomonas colorata]